VIDHAALLNALRTRMTVEHGWHGNPENHTLSATLFFGNFDPRPFITWDAHGHGTISDELIAQLAKETK